MTGYVSLFNVSNGQVQDADLANAVGDLQWQMNNPFWGSWGAAPYLDVGGGGTPIWVTDYPGPNDPQGALGYHYIDGNDNPFAVIFAGLCNDNGIPWAGVTSHELCEMTIDQEADTMALIDNGDGTGYIVYVEVCDPVESIYVAGPVNGFAISDFVTPNYYVPGDPNTVDWLGQLQGPLTLYSGGYLSYYGPVQLGQLIQPTADLIAKQAAIVREKIAKTNPRTDLRQQLQLQKVQAQALAQRGGQQPAQRQGQQGQPMQVGQPEQQRRGRGMSGPPSAGPPSDGPRIQTVHTPVFVDPSQIPQLAAFGQKGLGGQRKFAGSLRQQQHGPSKSAG
jgi:hypothetical protein